MIPKRTLIVLLSAVAVLGGCGGSRQHSESVPSGGTVEKTLIVASQKVLCEGEATQECLLIKDSPRSDWMMLYAGIDGFYFEEGFHFQLRVAATPRKNPPQDAPAYTYQLLEVVSQTTDATGGWTVLEDLMVSKRWRLEAFVEGSFEEPALISPEVTLEFTRDGHISGSGGCNQYFGEYVLGQNKSLDFSAIGATEMECSEAAVNQQQTRFFEALETVSRMEVGTRALRLYYGTSERALHFSGR
jgi:heat shock protein HslJ